MATLLEHHFGPACYPLRTLASHHLGRWGFKLGGLGGVTHHLGTCCFGLHRVHPHLGLQGLLHGGGAHEIDELQRRRPLAATFDQAYTLHLAEHTTLEVQAGGGRLMCFFFAVKHLGGRAGGVTHHQRVGTLVTCKVGVIGLAPALDHLETVAAHFCPPGKGGLFAHG